MEVEFLLRLGGESLGGIVYRLLRRLGDRLEGKCGRRGEGRWAGRDERKEGGGVEAEELETVGVEHYSCFAFEAFADHPSQRDAC